MTPAQRAVLVAVLARAIGGYEEQLLDAGIPASSAAYLTAEAEHLLELIAQAGYTIEAKANGEEAPKMTTENDIKRAVSIQLGNAEDNLYRAMAAAKRTDATQAWGQSGQTLQQIIDDYQAEVSRWKSALAELGQ